MFIRRKSPGDIKYLIMPVKLRAEAVGIWTQDNWYVKRVNLLYNMVYRRFNFKTNKRFYSLSFSSIFRYFYTMRVYIIGKLN